MDIQYLCPLISVYDMNVSLQFYSDVLGFYIHQSAGEKNDLGWVWLKRNNTDLMLNTAYETPDRPEQPDATRDAAHHDTILYLGCADVDAAYHELLSKGIKLGPPEIAPYGMKQLYCHDPDGYGICFQWPVKSVDS
jgi:glyoxylase I family protein